MEDYDWSERKDADFSNRYPIEWSASKTIVGFEAWSFFASHPGQWSQHFFNEVLPQPMSYDEKLTMIGERRVFISHRQCDLAEAQKVARIVKSLGWNYWLDVEDPTLQSISANASQGTLHYALAVASTIEFALLNCTHVVAVLTSNTPGSAWVPYEYGRVKPKIPTAITAICRSYVGIPSKGLPEYYYLNPICTDDNQLIDWLANRCA